MCELYTMHIKNTMKNTDVDYMRMRCKLYNHRASNVLLSRPSPHPHPLLLAHRGWLLFVGWRPPLLHKLFTDTDTFARTCILPLFIIYTPVTNEFPNFVEWFDIDLTWLEWQTEKGQSRQLPLELFCTLTLTHVWSLKEFIKRLQL
jgi:hypothetical protein